MICIPLMAETTEELLALMERAAPRADALELRLDALREPDIEALLAARTTKIIVTNRRRDEGGFFRGPEGQRVALLCRAAGGADFIDVELKTAAPLLEQVRRFIGSSNGTTQLILSHHDMEETPSLEKLVSLANDAIKAGADIVKIVTTARKPEDNLTVLSVIGHVRRLGVPATAFCMGEAGRISRIAAPFLGAAITYASLSPGAESAPGQLTVDEIETIMRILR